VTTYAFVNDSGVTELRGTLVPDPASIPLVSCVIARDAPLDVRTVADHPILWDALYDNYEDFGVLAAIPSGLGLTFTFNGSAATITTTTAGVWAFTYTGMTLAQDATWLGALDTRFGGQQLDVTGGSGLVAIVAQTLKLPSGVAFGPQVSVSAQATANPYALGNAYLIATRLG
jgi:hypothetical protein